MLWETHCVHFEENELKKAKDVYETLRQWAVFADVKHPVIRLVIWGGQDGCGQKFFKYDVEVSAYTTRKSSKKLHEILGLKYYGNGNYDAAERTGEQQELPF